MSQKSDGAYTDAGRFTVRNSTSAASRARFSRACATESVDSCMMMDEGVLATLAAVGVGTIGFLAATIPRPRNSHRGGTGACTALTPKGDQRGGYGEMRMEGVRALDATRGRRPNPIGSRIVDDSTGARWRKVVQPRMDGYEFAEISRSDEQMQTTLDRGDHVFDRHVLLGPRGGIMRSSLPEARGDFTMSRNFVLMRHTMAPQSLSWIRPCIPHTVPRDVVPLPPVDPHDTGDSVLHCVGWVHTSETATMARKIEARRWFLYAMNSSVGDIVEAVSAVLQSRNTRFVCVLVLLDASSKHVEDARLADYLDEVSRSDDMGERDLLVCMTSMAEAHGDASAQGDQDQAIQRAIITSKASYRGVQNRRTGVHATNWVRNVAALTPATHELVRLLKKDDWYNFGDKSKAVEDTLRRSADDLIRTNRESFTLPVYVPKRFSKRSHVGDRTLMTALLAHWSDRITGLRGCAVGTEFVNVTPALKVTTGHTSGSFPVSLFVEKRRALLLGDRVWKRQSDMDNCRTKHQWREITDPKLKGTGPRNFECITQVAGTCWFHSMVNTLAANYTRDVIQAHCSSVLRAHNASSGQIVRKRIAALQQMGLLQVLEKARCGASWAKEPLPPHVVRCALVLRLFEALHARSADSAFPARDPRKDEVISLACCVYDYTLVGQKGLLGGGVSCIATQCFLLGIMDTKRPLPLCANTASYHMAGFEVTVYGEAPLREWKIDDAYYPKNYKYLCAGNVYYKNDSAKVNHVVGAVRTGDDRSMLVCESGWARRHAGHGRPICITEYKAIADKITAGHPPGELIFYSTIALRELKPVKPRRGGGGDDYSYHGYDPLEWPDASRYQDRDRGDDADEDEDHEDLDGTVAASEDEQLGPAPTVGEESMNAEATENVEELDDSGDETLDADSVTGPDIDLDEGEALRALDHGVILEIGDLLMLDMIMRLSGMA